MRTSLLFCLFIVILPFNTVTAKLNVTIAVSQANYINTTGTSPYITISPYVNTISIEITTGLSFLIIQAHSIKHPIALFSEGSGSTFNRNIGLVQHIDEAKREYVFRLESEDATSAILDVQGYNKSAPIPGGCNLVNEPEEVPYLSLNTTNDLTEITVQAASLIGVLCEESHVKLEKYIYFFKNDYGDECQYYKQLEKMMTVDGILKYGRKVSEIKTNTRIVNMYNYYKGRRTIYAVIANSGNASSPYIPATPIYSEEESYLVILGYLIVLGGISAPIDYLLFIANISIIAWFTALVIESSYEYNPWFSRGPIIVLTILAIFVMKKSTIKRIITTIVVSYFFMNFTLYFSPLKDFVIFRNSAYNIIISVFIFFIYFCILIASKGILRCISFIFYTSNGLSMSTSGVLYYHFWFEIKRITCKEYSLVDIVIPFEYKDFLNILFPSLTYIVIMFISHYRPLSGYSPL